MCHLSWDLPSLCLNVSGGVSVQFASSMKCRILTGWRDKQNNQLCTQLWAVCLPKSICKYLCRLSIILEICCKSQRVKGQQACWFLQDFQLPLMVASSHASMQWPFYLYFIPGCFWLSGRHSSQCGNRALFNNNGATAASLRAFGQCWMHCGQDSWEGVWMGVLVTAIHHNFLKCNFASKPLFSAEKNLTFGMKQCWLIDK